MSKSPENPHPPPLMWTNVFFHHCFIILFQFLDIFFYIKSKKKREKWTQPETPPPPTCGLNPSKCFCLFFKFPNIVSFYFLKQKKKKMEVGKMQTCYKSK